MDVTPTPDELRKMNWVWEPSARCVKYLADELSLGGLIKIALTNQTGLPVFLDLAKQAIRAKGKHVQGLDFLIAHAESTAPRARDQLREGFHLLYVHALINMWAAALTALEQTVAGCISHDARAKEIALELLKDRGDRSRELPEDEVAVMASRLIQGSTKKKGAHIAYPELCAGFDIVFEAGKYPFEDLEEVRLARNYLVHRGGVIDQYAASRAPRLAPFLGKEIRIDDAMSVRHAHAITNFNLALSGAAIYSRYCLGSRKGASAN